VPPIQFCPLGGTKRNWRRLPLTFVDARWTACSATRPKTHKSPSSEPCPISRNAGSAASDEYLSGQRLRNRMIIRDMHPHPDRSALRAPDESLDPDAPSFTLDSFGIPPRVSL